MKEIIAKELLYFFVALMVAITSSFFFLYALNVKPQHAGAMTKDEKVLETELMIIGAIIGFLGVYVVRLAVWAVQKVLGVK